MVLLPTVTVNSARDGDSNRDRQSYRDRDRHAYRYRYPYRNHHFLLPRSPPRWMWRSTRPATRAYASEFGGTVAVINTATNAVVARITVGGSPDGVAVNPAGTRAYVASAFTQAVSVIDTASNAVSPRCPSGPLPAASWSTPLALAWCS